MADFVPRDRKLQKAYNALINVKPEVGVGLTTGYWSYVISTLGEIDMVVQWTIHIYIHLMRLFDQFLEPQSPPILGIVEKGRKNI